MRPRWLFQLLGLLLVAGVVAGAAYYLWPDSPDRDTDGDGEIATDALLQMEELPADWVEGEGTLVTPLEDGIKIVETRFADCTDANGFSELEDEPGGERSFHRDNISTISNRVLVAENDDRVTEYMETLRDPRAGLCLEALLERALQTNSTATLEDAKITMLDPPAFGDEAVWWRVEGNFSGGLLPVEVTVEVITLRVGRSITEFTFLGQFERIGVAVQRDAMRPVARRLEQGLADQDPEPG